MDVRISPGAQAPFREFGKNAGDAPRIEGSMTGILTDTSDASLAWAAKANLTDLNVLLARSPYTESVMRPGFFRWRTLVPHAFYNGVVCSALPDAGSPKLVKETVAYFRKQGPPSMIWWLVPEIPAAAWRELLGAHGFQLKPDLPGMAAEIAALAPARETGLEIRPVDSHRDRELWAATFAEGYGFPPGWARDFANLFGALDGDATYQGYLAFEHGQPVATSTLLLSSGVAGLYDVATLPAVRGRGYGTAVTLAPLLEAQERGYRVGVLQASPLGRPIYEKMGFRTVCDVEHFVWKDTPRRK